MNIFLRELKAHRKALIIWCAVVVLTIVSGMGKYTAYSSGNGSQVFDEMPKVMKAIFGIGSFDVTTISGFFGFLFSYILLIAGIHAVLLGSGIIAKEERDKTTEFLMIKPVSRVTVITSKLLAALANVVILDLITLLSSLAITASYSKGEDNSGVVSAFILSMFLVQLIFLSLGAMLAGTMKNPKGSGGLATGIMLGAFVISKITDITDQLSLLNILSPFKYFNAVDIVDGKGISFLIAVLSILLVAVFSGITYYFYCKRDLKV